MLEATHELLVVLPSVRRPAGERQRAAALAGRVVVTAGLDRHILCLLLGIPHLLLGDSYGKLRGFHAAWTHGAPDVRFASEPGEVSALAREQQPQ